MAEYQFCVDWGRFAEWVYDYQTLIAGMLAIFAGAFAYRGAIKQAAAADRQAETTLMVANIELHERRRAAAAALWSELANCRALLIAITKNLRDEHLLTYRMPRPVPTPIFDSNPSAVGLFASDEAFVVVNAYQMIKRLNDTSSRRREEGPHEPLQKNEAGHMAQWVEGGVDVITKALGGLRVTAGVSEEKASAMVLRYERADNAF